MRAFTARADKRTQGRDRSAEVLVFAVSEA
jgi:hypothetical protein